MRFYWIVYLLLFLEGSLFAQFKNILIDTSATNGRYPSEPSIAINFKNPKNVVAGSVHNNVYQSFDGGLTWTKSALVSEFGVWGDPVLVSSPSGDLYYLHLSDPSGKNWESEEMLDRIVIQKSKDGGNNWDMGESIGLNPPKDQDKPSAITDRKGNLYVSWTQFDTYKGDDPECKSAILFSKSSNGSKWSKPVTISLLSGDCKDDDATVMGATTAVSNDGKAFIVWSNNGLLYLDRSFDGGETWLTNDITMFEQTGGWNLKIPGIMRANGLPSLVCDNSKTNTSGALYLIWSDQVNGEEDTDVWFSRSYNFGDHWTQPMRIAPSEIANHQFMPALAVDHATGYLYIVYYDRDQDSESINVYLAYSTDNGSSFKHAKISEKPFVTDPNVFFGDYISISAYQGKIIPVWTRMDNGKTSIWTAVITHDELVKAK